MPVDVDILIVALESYSEPGSFKVILFTEPELAALAENIPVAVTLGDPPENVTVSDGAYPVPPIKDEEVTLANALTPSLVIVLLLVKVPFDKFLATI